MLVAAWRLDGAESASVLVPREEVVEIDVLAYDESEGEEVERRAAFGLSQPLYAKSPGGVTATARRTESYRPLVEDAVAGSSFDADLVEAIVFLESGGRPDVIAGDDPAGASGLTQILAETAQNFLAMDIDLDASRRLTARIAAAERRGDTVRAERLRALRRTVDTRFDPEQALAGTVRYLAVEAVAISIDLLRRPVGHAPGTATERVDEELHLETQGEREDEKEWNSLP